MLIVPEADALAVEAKVAPQDIDQLHCGQSGRCCASPPSTSAPRRRSTARSAASRPTYRRISDRRELLHRPDWRYPEEIARLGNVKLVPGMPVESFMKTYDRTVLSYFIKPLQDQVMRAFRER